MGRKNSKRQKLYRMKGCSKTRKNNLGGSVASASNLNLAYPSKMPTMANPFLAYNGKGGSSCSSPANLAQPQNMNGLNPVYPSSGPPSGGFNFLNPQGSQHGGCGCGLTGGSRRKRGKRGGMCPTCSLGFMKGGSHRANCKCSSCKMNGGSGNNGIPYPNGLVGQPWTASSSGWPGADSVSGNRNYLELNKYPTDPQTAMISTGANPPFSIGGKGSRRRKQRGGVLSNFVTQDLINLGRQFQYGVGSAYNALAGYQGPVNPMPWRGQLNSTPDLTTVKAAYTH